jgi:hypothetical protein
MVTPHEQDGAMSGQQADHIREVGEAEARQTAEEAGGCRASASSCSSVTSGWT